MTYFKITKRMKYIFPDWILADETFISQFASLVNLSYSSFKTEELLLYTKLTNEVSNMVLGNLEKGKTVFTREDYLKSINGIKKLVKQQQIIIKKQEIEKDFE